MTEEKKPTPDDLVARFDRRNAAHFVGEAEGVRQSRIIDFTRIGMMQRVLVEAKVRTAMACQLPPGLLTIEMVEGPNNRLVPALGLLAPLDTTLDEADTKKLGAVFGHAVSQVRREADDDFAFLDVERKMELREGLPEEDIGSFCRRLKAWLAKS